MIRYGYLYFLLWFKLVGAVASANHEFDNEYGVADECSIHFSVSCYYKVFYFKYLAIILRKTDSVL